MSNLFVLNRTDEQQTYIASNRGKFNAEKSVTSRKLSFI